MPLVIADGRVNCCHAPQRVGLDRYDAGEAAAGPSSEPRSNLMA